MHRVPIAHAQIGSVLMEPIVVDGVTVCSEGTTLTPTLKSSLLKFNVEEVIIESAIDAYIPEDVVRFKQLDNYMYSHIQNLPDEDIIVFANILVSDVINHEGKEFLNTLKVFDMTTYQHSINVACLACVIGITLRYDLVTLKNLTLGALLHDVGKEFIPLDILQKKGSLTPEEFEIIKQHPEQGVMLLWNRKVFPDDVKHIVLQHHENHDGSGYPAGLSGSEISKYAQIVHICDVYDALCAERPYKSAMRRDKARALLLSLSGTQFDPKMLTVFTHSISTYYLGEVLNISGHAGVVVDTASDEAVTVYSDGRLHSLDDFYKLV